MYRIPQVGHWWVVRQMFGVVRKWCERGWVSIDGTSGFPWFTTGEGYAHQLEPTHHSQRHRRSTWTTQPQPHQTLTPDSWRIPNLPPLGG